MSYSPFYFISYLMLICLGRHTLLFFSLANSYLMHVSYDIEFKEYKFNFQDIYEYGFYLDHKLLLANTLDFDFVSCQRLHLRL